MILVRHGASAAAVPGQPFALTEGHGDPPLAPRGEQQAAALAARLAHEPLRGLFITTLARTAQTAAPVAARSGLSPQVIRDLREVHLGDWDGGEYRIRIAQGDPVIARVFANERWDEIPNAEARDDFAQRVRRGLLEVVQRTGAGAVAAAVVHGGVIGELCHQATGSRPFAFVHVDNASISRLVVLGDGRWMLRSFNDTAHLEGAEA